MKSEEHKPIDL